MRHVIAVAAPIGGGKTSLVNAISNELTDAVTIHYDSYEKATGESADNLMQWVRDGACFDKLPVPGLAEDLNRLKTGQAIIEPLTGKEIKSKKYIIFEMPLGREYKATAEYIDFLIWVDIPFDLALARKLKEFTHFFLTENVDLYDRMLWLDNFLGSYIGVISNVLEIQRERVAPNADVILDGKKDLEALVSEAKESIRMRF